MNWVPYPKYKDSHVNWLGEIPNSWSVSPLKFHLDRNDGGVWGDDPDGVADTIVLRSTEQTVDGNWAIQDPAPRKLSAGDARAALLVEGDLLVTKSSGSSLHIGKTTIVTAEVAELGCCYSNFMQRLRTAESLRPRYAWYLMNHRLLREQFDVYSNSTTGLANLNATILGKAQLALPPVGEQDSILRFLDIETAKIDALIAMQEQLVARLREDRTATITHAVAGGLDPKVAMKDTGIEWLGEVPAHWHQAQMRHIVDRIEQGVSPQAYAELAEDGWGVLKSGCVNGGVFQDIQHKKLPAEFEIDPLIVVNEGDLLVCRASGSADLVGSTAIVRELKYRLILSDKIFRLIPSSRVRSDYLEWVMNSLIYREQVRGAISGAEGLANNLPISSLRSFRFPVPPLSEQKQIATYLAERCSTIDALTDKAQESTGVLREYRSALITDAVTGKIDVRGAA
jgi:type I restriction enzyme S subunit